MHGQGRFSVVVSMVFVLLWVGVSGVSVKPPSISTVFSAFWKSDFLCQGWIYGVRLQGDGCGSKSEGLFALYPKQKMEALLNASPAYITTTLLGLLYSVEWQETPYT